MIEVQISGILVDRQDGQMVGGVSAKVYLDVNDHGVAEDDVTGVITVSGRPMFSSDNLRKRFVLISEVDRAKYDIQVVNAGGAFAGKRLSQQ